MAERRQLPETSTTPGQRVLGLDFGKYLLSSDNRRHITMDSDNTTGTESDLSDWELGQRYNISENSEESDDYGIYYDQSHPGALSMFDTVIRSESDQSARSLSRQQNHQVENILAQMNSSNADSGYAGSLYPIQEAGSTMTDSSGSHDDVSEDTLSNSGSPIHHPVYGSYHKIQNQIDEARRMESDGSLERLMLHRLPGEYLGMILGIEGGKDGNGTVTSVCVKSVTLGGAAHRATGGSKGVCVGDEIVEVNGLDLHTLTHDECVQVFKDMPLRVMLGISRGRKDIPAVAITPLPVEKSELIKRQKNDSQNSPRFISPRELSDNEDDDGFAGFRIFQVTVEKDGTENLGLSIVPSYGSTKQYYQIKRILPSGSAARSGQLQVGDRLITCNGKNLRGLTQTHCLNIIRSASSYGNVTFEVIRPVYNGSSMEISVTVNPNSLNNNPYNQAYDPQQYSVKSQSYDRHVDVVVTSESEDYLTVSEDEYSKTGRLANIPEVEANEVFASNSVKLAFQKPFSEVEEESTATEPEPDNVSPGRILPREGLEIIDLNKGDTSPYHIPKRPSSAGGSTSPRASQSHHIKDNSVIPQSDIDKLVSPRSPRSPNTLKTDIDSVSVSSASPRTPIPQTDLDRFRIRTPSPVSPGRSHNSARTSYNKRQQVPVNDGESISPPFNYRSESISKDIPTDNTDAVRYNPLYDSNASEATDSDTVQDVYIASPYESPNHSSSLNGLNHDKDYNTENIAIGDNEVALPPPIEFSDNQDRDSLEQLEYSPVTNIDDLASSSVDVSPIHQEITVKPSYRYPSNTVLKLENSFTDLEEASSDKPLDIPIDYCDSELAFNNELTAPFDSVLQEHGECVHKTTSVPVEFADESDNDILQVVQSYDDGTIVISQFDANENRENTNSPILYNNRINRDTKMDRNSEAMLKDALDMDYEHLTETNKFETRIGLAGDMQPNQMDFEIELENGRNIIAEKVAKEMLQNEGGNFGYDMECDDEPDQYAGADEPEPEPELPMSPPPFLMTATNEIGEPIHQTVIAINGETPTDTEQSIVSSESDMERHTPDNTVDSNWSFRSKDTTNDVMVEDSEKITPVAVKRKVDISIDNLKIQHEEEDIVIPKKIERIFSAPKDFKEIIPVDGQEIRQAKKKAPPVAPKPSKSASSPRSPVDENCNSKSLAYDNTINLEPVQEHVFSATDVSEQRKKNLVNVISVVHALKAAKAHEDPDVVDKVVKVDRNDFFKKAGGTVININNGQENDMFRQPNNFVTSKENGQISPPKNDVVVSSKQTTSLSKPQSQIPSASSNLNGQISPPKQEVIVTTKQEIVKSKPKAVTQLLTERTGDTNLAVESKTDDKDILREEVKTPPVMKTSILVEKPKSPDTKDKPKTHNDNVGLKTNTPVPPLNLGSLNSPEVLPSNSEKSGERSPSSTYKTTIGVNKSTPDKPSTLNTQDKPSVSAAKMPQFRTLSPIKPLSFNPKSLSQTLPSRPVQYKTTINTKPSLGLSSLSNSQKGDHPIKRMETMPFEVSILKGILGIGIKTTMTPEGLVKISEILPSGPVGREGNIKVGDYLLSINGTQLTGLADSKVQQTLRLLPRGLSKLVASAVPPDPDTVVPTAAVKTKLTPQQSAPLSSLRKTTVTTNPEPLTISTRKPLVNTKSLPPALQLKKKDEQSPQLSPRSPKAPPPTLPKPKERTSMSPRGETSPRSPAKESILTPTLSPRQQSEMSPRSPPPPVAPKPARTQSQSSNDGMSPTQREDSSKPLETVIFASVNASKVESSKPGANILPGSVSYDSTKPISKTSGMGEVSSAAFKSQNGNDLEGKVDVVIDTQAQNVNELTNDSLKTVCNDQTSDNNNEQKTDDVKVDKVIEDVGEVSVEKSEADASFKAIVDGLSGRNEVDVALLANRNRSFSTSSDNESYTDFNECNVEDTEIPPEIVEVDENEAEFPSAVKSPVNDGSRDVKSDEYESDFEEFQNETVDKSKEGVDIDAMAANIVADVISTVKQMDLSKDEVKQSPPLPIAEPPISVDESSSVESAPPPPDGPPPLPTEAPPPIPDEAPPSLVNDSQALLQEKVQVVSQVVDLALYPDDIPTEQNMKNSQDKEGEEVIDVVSSYHSAQLHAEKPPLNVAQAHIADTSAQRANDIESISEQVTDPSIDQSGHTKDTVEDASVNIVIDMYSDIGNIKSKANEQTEPLEIVNKVSDEKENFEPKSISSSDIVLIDSENVDIVKDAADNERSDIKKPKELNIVKDTKLNGHAANSNNGKENLSSPRDTRKGSDGGTSLSPRSDSTYSPRTASVTSEDEGHGGRYVPDVSKVIRMLSQSEEPTMKGEAEEMMVTINKGVTGLGFVIEGGKLSVKGDLPISIKRIFKGGPAENLLQVGDEICEVNEEDITQMRRSEAWNHLKFLPSGDISMKILRYKMEPATYTDV